MPMNNEEKNDRESRYRDNQDDVRIMRQELNKLSGAVGDLVDCLKGNDFGEDGLVKQFKALKDETYRLKGRLDAIELSAKVNQKAWRIVYILLGTVGGTVLKIIIDHLIPVKK